VVASNRSIRSLPLSSEEIAVVVDRPRSKSRLPFLLPALLVLAAIPIMAQDEPRSPRNASYRLEVTLDPAARMLTGSGTLTWRNLQEQPADELRFHLYWNAWRNDQSTWMRGNRLAPRRGRQFKPREEDWGWSMVDAMRFEGADVLTAAVFESPDDGNPFDRTVLVVPLPRSVEPGETVDVDFEWHAKIPRTFARTGYRGDYFFIAQWFPKLGVWEPEGWNCHQFHSNTEFFSDYGVYDVTITVPAAFVVGSSGRETGTTENADGSVSHRFQEEDIHAFTWTASPDYLEQTARFEEAGLPPVELRLLYQPEHQDQVERHLDATRAALKNYGSWYGPYPYGHVTVIDPAYGSGAGGMEYPTLFTCGTRLGNPVGGGSPEGVTIHEAGHQFWYGIVGDNEFENAWLDEGLNTFSTARAYDVTYGERLFVKDYLDPPGARIGGFLPVMFSGLRMSRAVYGNRLDRFLASFANNADAQAVPTYRYFPPTHAQLSYGKTSLWLATLERHLGWDVLQRILSTFFERWKFRHPRPQDFFDVADEIAGEDLSWFFDQVHGSSVDFDYAVDSVASLPARAAGFVDDGGEPTCVKPAGEPDAWRTEVVVRRHGGGIFPVTVLLVFEDGSEERIAWDGKERWRLFAVERPVKLRHAIVDPERVLLLDVDYTNNSRAREPAAGTAVVKWSSRWMTWLQDLLITFTFFV
jgi:Peptidase family M1 domain